MNDKQVPQVRVKNYFYHNNVSLQFENYSDTWCDQVPSFSNSKMNREVRRIIYLRENKQAILLKNNALAEVLKQN